MTRLPNVYTSDFSFLCLQFLASCVVGATHVSEQVQDEPANESSSREGVYQIVGTVSGKNEKKSSFAVEEYTVSEISKAVVNPAMFLYVLLYFTTVSIELNTWRALPSPDGVGRRRL